VKRRTWLRPNDQSQYYDVIEHRSNPSASCSTARSGKAARKGAAWSCSAAAWIPIARGPRRRDRMRDIVLAHSTRGPDDQETMLARDMAAHLKLEFHSFQYDPEDAVSALPEMFDAYPTVNDYSMMATSLLARQIVEAFPERDNRVERNQRGRCSGGSGSGATRG
jgi:hypothetical protein